MATIGYVNERDRKGPSVSELDALDKNDIPIFDRNFAGYWNEDMQLASDVFLFGALASPAMVLAENSNDYLTIGLLYAETLILSGGGIALSKGSITRLRPYAYGDKAPTDEKTKIDTKRSFFSGHAALAASGLFFTATVHSDYNPNSQYKNHVWGAAIGGSLLVAGLRVAGGKHFPTDVITGLMWGGAIGYAVPASHRKNQPLKIFPFINKNSATLNFFLPY